MAKHSLTKKRRAVDILNIHGDATEACMATIRQELGDHKITPADVRHWRKVAYYDAAPPGLVPSQPVPIKTPAFIPIDTDDPLDIVLEKIARNYLMHAMRPDVMEKLDGAQAIRAATQALEKMRLLRELPTEIVGVLPQLVKSIEESGMSAGTVFNEMIKRLKSGAARGSTSGTSNKAQVNND